MSHLETLGGGIAGRLIAKFPSPMRKIIDRPGRPKTNMMLSFALLLAAVVLTLSQTASAQLYYDSNLPLLLPFGRTIQAYPYYAPTYQRPTAREFYYDRGEVPNRATEAAGCPYADGRCYRGSGYAGRVHPTQNRVAVRRQPVRTQARLQPPPPPRRTRVAAESVSEQPISGALPHARAIQSAINSGSGRSAGSGMCGRAVWRILWRAGLVHHGNPYSSGVANAKDFGPRLRGEGFVLDMNACNKPGVVRIYSGNRSGHTFRNHMTGDTAGHIEIIGLDHMYHSFFDSSRSISQSMQARFGYASRRPLQSCWYKP
jgi:hypothetical protein